MNVTVGIRNKNLVVASDTYGTELAKAYRVDPQHDWFIGVRMTQSGSIKFDEEFRVVGTVSTSLPEVLQRKMILWVLRSLIPEANELG